MMMELLNLVRFVNIHVKHVAVLLFAHHVMELMLSDNWCLQIHIVFVWTGTLKQVQAHWYVHLAIRLVFNVEGVTLILHV